MGSTERPDPIPGFEAPVPSMETLAKHQIIIAVGPDADEPKYRNAGALVIRNGLRMVIYQAYPETQFHGRSVSDTEVRGDLL